MDATDRPGPSPPPRGSLRTDTTGLLAGSPVGIVTISWRPPPPTDLDRLLAELHRMGYDGVQLGDTFPTGDELVSLLRSHRMRLAEVYAALPCTPAGPTPDALDRARARLRLADEAEGEVLVVALDGTPDRDARAGRAVIPGTPGLSEEGWKRLSQLLAEVADETQKAGHTAAFHPHAGTYVETPDEVIRLLDVTEGTGMGICLDTGHDIVGGGDPLETLRRIGPRLSHLHLKDVDPRVLTQMRREGGFATAVQRRIFAPLGSGVLDLAGVLTHLHRAGYAGWLMIEQDSTWEPPAEAAAISRRVLDWALHHLAAYGI